MPTEPTVPDRCICGWTDPSTWTTHCGAVEPGSQREWNPECPEHPPIVPDEAAAEAAARALALNQGKTWEHLAQWARAGYLVDARAVLAAARPILDAQTGERITPEDRAVLEAAEVWEEARAEYTSPPYDVDIVRYTVSRNVLAGAVRARRRVGGGE